MTAFLIISVFLYQPLYHRGKIFLFYGVVRLENEQSVASGEGANNMKLNEKELKMNEQDLKKICFLKIIDDLDSHVLETVIVATTNCYDIVSKAIYDWDNYEIDGDDEYLNPYEFYDCENVYEFIFRNLNEAGIVYITPNLDEVKI